MNHPGFAQAWRRFWSGLVRPAQLVLLSLCLVLTWTPSAVAEGPSEEAQDLFHQAEVAFDAEDYARAAKLFEQANHHAPHPSVLFNAAVSWDHAGEFARAANDYRAALEGEGLNPDQTEESERRLAALSERLGYVQVAKPIGSLITVGPIDREPVPARFYLQPGNYEVSLETDGTTTKTSISVEAGQTLKVSLNVAVHEQPNPEPVPAPPPPGPTAPLEQPSSTQATLGWISVGVGVVAAGVAVYLGTEALSAKDALLRDRTQSRYQTADDLQTQTNVAWGAAGIAGGLGAVLLLTAPTVEF